MGKYSQKKRKHKKSSSPVMWIVIACCIALPVAIIAISWILQNQPAAPATPTTTTLTPQSISLNKGDNVITTDGDNIELKYSVSLDSLVSN